MSNGYSRSPKLLKGALIRFSAPLLIPIPDLIVFQYNPETMSRTLTPWAPREKVGENDPAKQQADQQSQPTDPEETFTLALELDAADALENPGSHPVAAISGVADRLAALEMLMYPEDTDGGLLGSLNVSVSVSVGAGGISASAGAGAAAAAVPRKTAPIVLFFWGPGRIVPVRITSFGVEEQAYNPILYPLRAKVSLGLKILDDTVLAKEAKADPSSAIVKIAQAAYKFTRTQKKVLALANIANSVESIMGMLPL